MFSLTIVYVLHKGTCVDCVFLSGYGW